MTPFAAEASLDWTPLFVTWASLSASGLDVRFADGLTWRMALAELSERIGGDAVGLALDERHETVVLQRADRRRIPLPWDGLRAMADAAYREQLVFAEAHGNAVAGARIRGWRKAAGMTQAELALASGLSRTTISRLEGGQQSPNHATIQVLAAALRVSAGELTTGVA